MKCGCGSNRFRASQRVVIDVIVDEEGNWVCDDKDTEDPISSFDKPFGPYECVNCGKEYDTLEGE